MGQASSQEKKRRNKKGTHSNGGLRANESPRRTSSLNKPANRSSSKGTKKSKSGGSNANDYRKQQQLKKQVKKQNNGTVELGTCGVERIAHPESPRYGIFDDLKPTVCIDEDGVSLSSVSSDDDTVVRRSAPSKPRHRLSSRRLRRTYSAGRRRSRAGRIAKKSHTPKPCEAVSTENSHEDLNVPAAGVRIIQKDSYLMEREDSTTTGVSGDDSGCSTLEDHLFPDDSLSEEVLGCLVTRGLEFDSDTSTHSLPPISKARRDEGYESLQKIAQCPDQTPEFGATVSEVRHLILSTSLDTQDSLTDMSQWTLRHSSLSDEDRLSVSGSSEAVETADTPNGKSSWTDSFSDSGCSSKTKLSSCETEAGGNLEISHASRADSEEKIDWLEEPSVCVDDSFNEHFARVLGFPKTTTCTFYEGTGSVEHQEDGKRARAESLPPVPAPRRLAVKHTEQQPHDKAGDMGEVGRCDRPIGRPISSSSLPTELGERTCVRLSDKRVSNPSEVYV